jgi:CysZ protein
MIGNLLGGASLLARGFGLVITRRRLFLLGGIPPLITSIVFLTVLITLVTNLDRLVPAIAGFASDWQPALLTALQIVVGVALVGGSVLIMVLLFSSITLLIGSPAYDKIAEFVDQELGEIPEPSTGAGRAAEDENTAVSVGRSVAQSLVLIAISLLGTIAFFLLGFIPLLGQIVVPVLSTIFGGWMLTTELLGPAFERRGLKRLSDRRQAMAGQKVRSIGFAVPTFLLLAIPFVSILVFPAATAGATMLARELVPREPE